jgi:glycine oxidase
MSDIDLVFVGNGIISCVSAIKVKVLNPNKKIMVIGKSARPHSASVAAGAMQAVFCEIEETFNESQRDQEIFYAALEARSLWLEFLNQFGLTSTITADSTIMYRRKQGTIFEEANFDVACEVASRHQCLAEVTPDTMEAIFCGNLKPADVVAKTFSGELAIDTEDLFQKLTTLMEKLGIVSLNDEVIKIAPESDGINIQLKDTSQVRSARVVVAAGTLSQSLLPSDFPQVPVYHAVGTAFVLNSAPLGYSGLNKVVRSPNRGGAQCGIHIVPRNGGKYYLGAGNYLSNDLPAHRMETIRYLIDICENELFGKQVIYNAKTELLLGSRPKSIDGFPVVGWYTDHPNIFIATGMYRIGLTIAPLVAQDICRWYSGQEPSEHFRNCSPERVLHSYGDLAVAVKYYSESRISNLIEHGLIDINDQTSISVKKIDLENISRNNNQQIVKKYGFPSDFVIDPDLYSMLLSNT